MRRRLFINLGLLLCLLACGKDGKPRVPLETVHDLTAGVDIAEIDREPGLVDLGTPGARPWLREGWGQDEADGGRTFVWSDGPESRLELFLAAARDVPLTLRGLPYPAPGAPPQEVSLVLNGDVVGRFVPGREDGRVVLPAGSLRAGANQLVFRYAWTRSPWEESGGRTADHRRLAVAWDLLRFDTGVDERGRVRAAGGQLAIPFGWRVTTYLRLPAGAVLSMEGLRSREGPSGELWVTVRVDDGEEKDAGRLSTHEGAATLDLEVGREGLARVSLAAVAAVSTKSGGGGLVLRRPLLLAPRAAKTVPSVLSAGTAPAAFHPAGSGRPFNVVVYLVDTLRADHLGCYGYGKPVSPRIDAFAREAALFRHAVAQAPWTRPAVATILTGLLPRTHGVNRKKHALAPEAVTLAETLRDRGYRTAGFITNGNVARSFGFGQGFDIYELLGRRRSAATDVNARAALWLEKEWKRDAPFFLYLHTVEPHAPYAPPEPFRQRFAPGAKDEALTRMRFLHQIEEGKVPATPELRRNLLDLYDAEIAANDAAFGNLIDLLHQRGLWQDTVVVFVSDHGEEFLDHGGWEHGRSLHTEMLDVPLIVRIPGLGNGQTVDRQAQHADVVPTILDALGLPVPAAVEGRSLLPWLAGRAPEGNGAEEAFSWLDEYGIKAASVTTPEWRLIDGRLPTVGRSLYDRRSDPRERSDLAADRPVRAGYLATRIRSEERPRKGMLRAGEGTLDPEVRQQLRALGYIH
ncbi:MAG TPA: sulfatase [Thermoanaerobaculia bacterium]|jgi:arylsulfatase A-like enzyme|nr:sulfatase [Thermoanaerobaculia bacterium]